MRARNGPAPREDRPEIPATAKKQVSRRQGTPAGGQSRRCRHCGRVIVRRRAVALGVGWRCEQAGGWLSS